MENHQIKPANKKIAKENVVFGRGRGSRVGDRSIPKPKTPKETHAVDAYVKARCVLDVDL